MWHNYHKEYEKIMSQIIAVDNGDKKSVRELYKQAGNYEELALNSLNTEKIKTRVITALSAASCYCKGGDLKKAKEIANNYLELSKNLGDAYYRNQLELIIESTY